MKWSKKDTADVAGSAAFARRCKRTVGPQVLAAVIQAYREYAQGRRSYAAQQRETAAHYRAHFCDEARAALFDRLAIGMDREAAAFDRIADRLQSGDLPRGVFAIDETPVP